MVHAICKPLGAMILRELMFSLPSRFETSSIVILSWPATSSRPRKSKPTLRMGFGFAITINSYYDSSSPPIRDSSSEIKRTRCYCQDGKFSMSNRRYQFNIPILNTNRRSTTATHDARIYQIVFLILSSFGIHRTLWFKRRV
jgi:hypothetical protein